MLENVSEYLSAAVESVPGHGFFLSHTVGTYQRYAKYPRFGRV
jgi:hypothetical protein